MNALKDKCMFNQGCKEELAISQASRKCSEDTCRFPVWLSCVVWKSVSKRGWICMQLVLCFLSCKVREARRNTSVGPNESRLAISGRQRKKKEWSKLTHSERVSFFSARESFSVCDPVCAILMSSTRDEKPIICLIVISSLWWISLQNACSRHDAERIHERACGQGNFREWLRFWPPAMENDVTQLYEYVATAVLWFVCSCGGCGQSSSGWCWSGRMKRKPARHFWRVCCGLKTRTWNLLCTGIQTPATICQLGSSVFLTSQCSLLINLLAQKVPMIIARASRAVSGCCSLVPPRAAPRLQNPGSVPSVCFTGDKIVALPWREFDAIYVRLTITVPQSVSLHSRAIWHPAD